MMEVCHLPLSFFNLFFETSFGTSLVSDVASVHSAMPSAHPANVSVGLSDDSSNFFGLRNSEIKFLEKNGAWPLTAETHEDLTRFTDEAVSLVAL